MNSYDNQDGHDLTNVQKLDFGTNFGPFYESQFQQFRRYWGVSLVLKSFLVALMVSISTSDTTYS